MNKDNFKKDAYQQHYINRWEITKIVSSKDELIQLNAAGNKCSSELRKICLINEVDLVNQGGMKKKEQVESLIH